jgi:polar amino acid transport system substrate-binding protein
VTVRRVTLVLISGVLLAAWGGATAPTAAPTADPTTDKLANVQARGTLLLSTDPEYAPQSMKVEGAARAPGTRCAPNQLTGPEMTGYDAETGKLVAAALGVEPCFVTPPWSDVIGGNWSDRWDVAWGSGALSTERMERLWVTQPYYSTPHAFFVRADSPYERPSDLDGKQIGACSGCTHELYLRRTLDLPGAKLEFVVDDPKIVTFEAEPPGLAALAAGKLDAFLCGEPVGDAEIANGVALRKLAPPAYTTEKTGYVDKGSSLKERAFVDAVDTAIAKLHAAGKLKALSQQFFGVDFATAAGAVDLASIHQTVP